MSENKRFCKGYYSPEWYTVCEIEKDEEVICTVALKDADFIIKIFEKNEKLEKENEKLKQALLFYLAIALTDSSTDFQNDIDKWCNILFNCDYKEAKKRYGDFEYDRRWELE